VTSAAGAAEIFREIADLLDVLGERFKPEAYRRAARSLDALGEDLAGLARDGKLDEIPGVGEAIGEKIREYLRDGRIAYRDRLARQVPPGLVELLKVPGLGPKTVRRFWIELGIDGPAALAAAVEAGKLDGVKGFGPTKLQQIRTALRAAPTGARIGLLQATRVADALVAGLRAAAPVDRIEIAGSFRRGRETVGDLDLLVLSPEPEAVFDAFGRLPEVAEVLLRGGTKETVRLRTGLQVDLRIVPARSYGAALQYFTGSKDHNVRLRSRARDLGLKVNEYAVARDDHYVAGATEAEVYEALGLREIPPELREDRGEIDLAEAGRLPTLLPYDGIRGDLHVHARELEGARAGAGPGATYVGWVLPNGTAPEELAALRERARDGFPVRFGVEGTVAELRNDPMAALADYRLLVAGRAPAPPDVPTLPECLAAVHLDLTEAAGGATADPVQTAGWIAWAKAHGAALEVTAEPNRNGLDSAGARTALAQGVALLVSAGAERGGDPVRLGVAVKLVRRAGATAAEVRNAAEAPPGGPTPPRSTPTRRPRRTAP